MKIIEMVKSAGARGAGSTQDVGNKTARYLVDRGYARYVDGTANPPPKVKAGRKVNAWTTAGVTGKPEEE